MFQKQKTDGICFLVIVENALYKTLKSLSFFLGAFFVAFSNTYLDFLVFIGIVFDNIRIRVN